MDRRQTPPASHASTHGPRRPFPPAAAPSCSLDCAPLPISSIIVVYVDIETLYVEFIDGYAGVMTGIMWLRSAGFHCAPQDAGLSARDARHCQQTMDGARASHGAPPVTARPTRGFQTGKPKGPSSISLRTTGLGHFLCEPSAEPRRSGMMRRRTVGGPSAAIHTGAPLFVNLEKLDDNGGRERVWVELADACRHERPGNAAEVADLVGVHPAPCGGWEGQMDRDVTPRPRKRGMSCRQRPLSPGCARPSSAPTYAGPTA